MLVRKDNLSVEQLLTSLHGVKLAIFDPLFCEQKIKSQLPLLIASNAIVGSYNDQKQIINEYLNKKDRISPIPERQSFDHNKKEKTLLGHQLQLKDFNKCHIDDMIEEFKKLNLCS